ncbi:MAG: DUF5343 domain-containing protein [Sphingomonas sp.]
MANLPYVTATGNVAKALNNIAAAATPDAVTQNFVKTMLKISGGSGNQMTSFLKKIGFVNTDGTPSEIYRKFRNSATRGAAAAESLKFGYAPLYKRNEFLHELSDKDLKGLILEETGMAAESSAPGLILSCIKSIRQFADFSKEDIAESQADNMIALNANSSTRNNQKNSAASSATPNKIGFNVGYNINLNLPATTDIAVFNAIFKSLKENFLPGDDA